MGYLKDKIGVSEKKVALINNGVGIPRSVSQEEVEQLKASLGVNDTDLIIGTVGRMNDDGIKRFSDLIKAFQQIVKKIPNAKLLLIGDGPELVNYKQLSKELEIEKSVLFAGYQSDTAVYYKVMDIFSLVSNNEAFGLVLAEAMLHSLPIVATAVGGMKYIVVDGETGFLVKRHQVDEIANKIIELCENKELRDQFGENGLQRANELYTEKKYVEAVRILYKDLLIEKGIE